MTMPGHVISPSVIVRSMMKLTCWLHQQPLGYLSFLFNLSGKMNLSSSYYFSLLNKMASHHMYRPTVTLWNNPAYFCLLQRVLSLYWLKTVIWLHVCLFYYISISVLPWWHFFEIKLKSSYQMLHKSGAYTIQYELQNLKCSECYWSWAHCTLYSLRLLRRTSVTVVKSLEKWWTNKHLKHWSCSRYYLQPGIPTRQILRATRIHSQCRV